MRRILLTAIASATVLAVAPATSLARGHHHGRHHHARHARVEHFGSDASQTGSNQSASSATDNAGTVSSFSGGVLTIKLNDGSMASGQVNGDTEIECRAPENVMSHDGGGDGGGDNGSGDGSQGGDDNQQSTTTTSQQSGDDEATENENQNEVAENENQPAAGNQADNDNDDNGADTDNDENQGQAACGMANLTPGTVVREAELRISSAGSTWKKVELITG